MMAVYLLLLRWMLCVVWKIRDANSRPGKGMMFLLSPSCALWPPSGDEPGSRNTQQWTSPKEYTFEDERFWPSTILLKMSSTMDMWLPGSTFYQQSRLSRWPSFALIKISWRKYFGTIFQNHRVTWSLQLKHWRFLSVVPSLELDLMAMRIRGQ